MLGLKLFLCFPFFDDPFGDMDFGPNDVAEQELVYT